MPKYPQKNDQYASSKSMAVTLLSAAPEAGRPERVTGRLAAAGTDEKKPAHTRHGHNPSSLVRWVSPVCWKRWPYADPPHPMIVSPMRGPRDRHLTERFWRPEAPATLCSTESVLSLCSGRYHFF